MAPAAQKTLVGDLPSAAASPQVYGHTHPSHHYQSPFQTVDLRGQHSSIPKSISHFISSQLLRPFKHCQVHPAPRVLLILAYLVAFLGLVLFLRGAAKARMAALLQRRRRSPVGQGLPGVDDEKVVGSGGDDDEKRDRAVWLLGGDGGDLSAGVISPAICGCTDVGPGMGDVPAVLLYAPKDHQETGRIKGMLFR
ncbi:hypothetical protein VPNG_00501 [Cytospora leucostoma]|uniref:Uncharacterized protein n=1 Tax=Cytospora leucostoma TaxID=1230097 RepID=A0A423XNE0_9PEZI|nr:hypothetical protein VPNG_00501 [Cytospora leucostoma]